MASSYRKTYKLYNSLALALTPTFDGLKNFYSDMVLLEITKEKATA